jgi:hypothetical protein
LTPAEAIRAWRVFARDLRFTYRGAERTWAEHIRDCVRMLEASDRRRDSERLERLRRLMELERQRTQQRRLTIER